MYKAQYISRLFTRKVYSVFFIVFPFLILILWFFIKVFQFQSLQVNFCDGILALQLSRGWLENRPFLYDTFYGFHAKIHNYYFLPITGFFTIFTGVYGFFILYLSLLALLLGNILLWLRKKNRKNWTTGWLVLLIFLIGPITFTVYLDLYGWHPEQYFFPSMGLLAFFMARRQLIWSVLLLILICSIKETSSVLICGLLLFSSVLDLTLKDPKEGWFKLITHPRNILILVICLLFFSIGMYWLTYLNGSESSRLVQAFDHLRGAGSPINFLLYLLEAIIHSILLFSIGILPFLPWLRITPKKNLIFSVLIIYFFTLVFVFFIEGLYYYPVFRLSLPYPSRVGGLWAFLLSCYIFMSIRLTEDGFMVKNNQRDYSLWSFIFQLIFYPLLISQERLPTPDLDYLGISIISFFKAGLGTSPYSDRNAHQLFSLAKKLPPGSEVITPTKYLPIFQHVYACEWNHKKLALRKPMAYIYEKVLLRTSKEYDFSSKGYLIIPNDDLLILVDSTWHTQQLKSVERNVKNG